MVQDGSENPSTIASMHLAQAKVQRDAYEDILFAPFLASFVGKS
jgi:hypothetical protein